MFGCVGVTLTVTVSPGSKTSRAPRSKGEPKFFVQKADGTRWFCLWKFAPATSTATSASKDIVRKALMLSGEATMGLPVPGKFGRRLPVSVESALTPTGLPTGVMVASSDEITAPM